MLLAACNAVTLVSMAGFASAMLVAIICRRRIRHSLQPASEAGPECGDCAATGQIVPIGAFHIVHTRVSDLETLR
jgi:hypothetical protein